MGIENPVHLLFIGLVALVVLGPRRLPELARALGKGVREFREAISQEDPSHAEPFLASPARVAERPRVEEAVLVGEPAGADEVAPLSEPSAARESGLAGEPTVAHEPAAGARPMDPAQTLRSGDAPDRRPL